MVPVVLYRVVAATILILSTCIVNAGVPAVGPWHGKLKLTEEVQLTLVFHFDSLPDGSCRVLLDSPEQSAYGIPCEPVYMSADSVNVTVKSINADYKGKIDGGKIVGVFRQFFKSYSLILSPGLPEQRRPQTPIPPFPYTTREVTFRNETDSVSLNGTLSLPAGYDESTPVVLMVTGSGIQNRDEELFGHKPFAVIADYLARRGIASLRYDDRGYNTQTSESYTTDILAGDAAAGVKRLRDIDGFRHVGVLGHSEGANISFILGSRSSAPDFLVAIAPMTVRGDSLLNDQVRYQLSNGGMPNEIIDDYIEAMNSMYVYLKRGDKNAARKSVERHYSSHDNTPSRLFLKDNLFKIIDNVTPWLEYFLSFSPKESISSTSVPAMVIYGERDRQVNVSLNESEMKRLKPDADIRVYSELNHLMQHANTGSINEYATIEETISAEVLEDIAQFIMSLYRDEK